MKPAGLRIAIAAGLLAALASGPTAALAAEAASAAKEAAPDQKLKDELKAGIDVAINWLRWQLAADGTWKSDPLTTATGVRVFAESHRKYIEDDGPFMRRPVAFIRHSVDPQKSRAAAATVLALKPLKNADDDKRAATLAPAFLAILSEGARAGRPLDLEEVSLLTAAARAGGVPAGGELLAHVEALVDRGTVKAQIPAFRESLGLHALLVAGAPKDHKGVEARLAALRANWGWWKRAKAGEGGTQAAPPRYWQALVRALDALGPPAIADEAGASHDWKTELARQVLGDQQFDGFWLEQNDKIDATIAAVAALEIIYR